MFCGNCGHEVQEGRSYCSACGAAVAPDAPPAAFSHAPPPYASGPMAPPAWGPPAAGPPPAPANKFSTIAIVLGCIALFVLPILLGPAALVLAGIALSKKEPRGTVAMVVAVIGTVGGFALGALVVLASGS